jgi:iron complex outermembrane receptor protein
LALSPTSQLRNTLSIRRFADEYFGAESYGFEAPDTVTRAGLYFLHDRDPLLNQSQLHVTARLPQIHRILIGYEYQRFPSDTDRSNFLTVTPISLSRPVETEPARDRFPTARWIRFRQNIHAIYAQDHIELTPKLKLLAGVRADIFRRWNRTDPVSSAGAVAMGAVNTRNLEAVTGRAGLVYNLAPSYSVYGSWSSAFRPNFQVPFDNRVLEPEQGRQFEVGQRLQSPDGRLAVNVAVYQLNKSNVTFARVGNIFDQAGRVRSRGIEIDVDARVDSRTTIAANYSFNNIRFQDFFAGSVNLTGFRPRYAPRHTGNLWATRSFGAMTFALGGQYVGRMFSDNTNLVPIGEYFLADAAVTWRREVWEVGLNVANLFNKERYFPTSIYDTQLYPGSPVSAMISVRWRK